MSLLGKDGNSNLSRLTINNNSGELQGNPSQDKVAMWIKDGVLYIRDDSGTDYIVPTLPEPSTKGTIIVSNADNEFANVTAGANGKFLKADSTQTNGLLWDDAPSGITDLSDLLDSPPSSGEVPQYNGSVWSSAPLTSVNSLSELIDDTVNSGETPFYNGTSWVSVLLPEGGSGSDSLGGLKAVSTTTSVTATSTWAVQWCQDVWDDLTLHAWSPNPTRVTSDEKARWFVHARVLFETGASGGYVGLSIRKDGSTTTDATILPVAATTTYAIEITTTVELDEDDYIEIIIENRTSHDLSVGQADSGDTSMSFGSILSTLYVQKLQRIETEGVGAADDCS